MSQRERSNPFEQAKVKYETVTSSQPIARAALVNAIFNLEETATTQQASGAMTLAEFAGTMRDALTPIETPEYTKPPLSAEQFGEYIGKLDVYSRIAEAQNTTPQPATEPTDTKKIDTAKRKG